MILSDTEIRKRLESWDILMESSHDVMQQIGPASLDFRLGNAFKMYKRGHFTSIDSKNPTQWVEVETITIPDGESFVIHPGQFVLGVTLEKIKVPHDLVARCEWRSSLGRLGIILHSTAGYIDPGFAGTITLEMTNINEVPVILYPGMRIGQYVFETIHGTVEVPYDQRKGSKYMDQELPEESRVGEDLY